MNGKTYILDKSKLYITKVISQARSNEYDVVLGFHLNSAEITRVLKSPSCSYKWCTDKSGPTIFLQHQEGNFPSPLRGSPDGATSMGERMG